MTIPESVRALVATGPNAHLTTLNADGSPQVTVGSVLTTTSLSSVIWGSGTK
jgi:hypothetical protein